MKNLAGLKSICLLVLGVVVFAGFTFADARYMERLGRGVVAVRTSSSQVYVSWRMLGTEWGQNIGYHVYRGTTRITSSPVTNSTNLVDTTTIDDVYSVSPVIDGVEGSASEPVGVWNTNYLTIPLQVPAGLTMPDSSTCTYSPNDCSVGDLDGDGEYEIILKWDPSNAKDNSQSGYTGNVYLDAYKLDGTLIWRIDLGINIRAGAHYTQFMVYDLDSDGKAELACKTAPYTVDGLGNYVLLPGDTLEDYRNTSGYILSGPEYLTIFDGQTGAEMTTVSYNPPRHPTTLYPTSTELNAIWGDGYGNRVDRFLACVAYLDGQKPSLVMCRGYYTRTVLAAWDWRDGQLTQRWVFDSSNPGWGSYAGQGNHNLSVGDVDGDGKDEIVYGACTIDDDGEGLYNTGIGHGDAMHLGDLDPERPGLEIFNIHEPAGTDAIGSELHDAATGQIIWSMTPGDVGRGCADDIYAGNSGGEMWASNTAGLRDSLGNYLGRTPGSTNFLAWWDDDLVRELLDSNHTDKYGTSSDTRLLTASNCSSNNGTKSTPGLSGDILGDWREEVIFRTSDNTSLRIYTTTTPTSNRLYTLMHDSQYRLSIAWQNVAYNQPPHTSFHLGEGMSPPPVPQLIFPGPVLYGDFNLDTKVDMSDLPTFVNLWLEDNCTLTAELDLNEDCIINFFEFAAFAGNWEGPDLTPPSAPTGLSATAGGETVWLDWNDNSEDDLSGYNVYRSETSGSGYTLINSSLLSVSGYTDQTITDGITYYYVVTAADISSNESEYSNEVTVITIPAAPTNLLATAIDGQVMLDWDDNSESDLSGYIVYRSDTSGGDYVQLNTSLLSSSDYIDNDVVNETTYYYIVTAVDTSSNESDGSSEVSATPVQYQILSITIQENEAGLCTFDGTIDNNNAGFTGDGFINTPNAEGSEINWSIQTPAAGTYTLTWRYSNASGSRPANLIVNGTTVLSGISFPNTANWTTWADVSVDVSFSPGVQAMRLEATSSNGLANIDYLMVTGLSPAPASCP